MNTTEILTGIKNWVVGKLVLKQDVISDLATIRSGAAAGATAVQPSDLSAYFNDAAYDGNSKRINFYHGQTIVAYIDATAFVIDGMVEDVRIENGYLIIDFNTASGKQDISIPLTDIFDPSNYYTKTQTDTLLAEKEAVANKVTTIDGDSTDTQYPSAKAVHGFVEEEIDGAKEDIDTKLDEKANYDGYYSGMTVGSAEGLIGSTVSSGQFLYRQTNGGIPVAAGLSKIECVKGSTVVWNQIGEAANSSSAVSGITRTKIDSATIKISGECTETNNFTISKSYAAIVGHKYASIIDKAISGVGINYAANIGKRIIIENASTTSKSFGLYITSGTSIDETLHPNVIDLTKMFGSDAQIAAALGIQEADITTDTGVAAFESWLAQNVGLKDYYPYNAGELIPVKMTGVKTVGFNQWDEEWENGYYNAETGAKASSSSSLRNMNPIKATTQSHYYLKCPANMSSYVFCYNGSGSYIGLAKTVAGTQTNIANTEFELVDGTVFINFYVQSYGTTYNHDICINLSDTTKNGTYEPYWTDEASLPVTTLTGKLNGEGESVVVFPDGLKKAGSVYDEIKVENGVTKAIKRIGSADLGTLTWIYRDYGEQLDKYQFRAGIGVDAPRQMPICAKYSTVDPQSFFNNYSAPDKSIAEWVNGLIGVQDSAYTDAATFKAAMNGVMLYYKLATPEEYILDAAPVTMKVDPAGTEQVLPENTTDIVTCAPTLDIVYPFDMGSKEDKGNKVTSLSSESTDEQYPSAKAVYDALTSDNSEIQALARLLVQQQYEIDGLKKMVEGNMGDIRATTINTDDMPMVSGKPLVIVENGAPTKVPYFVGQIHVNRSTNPCTIKVCYQVTGSISDWK